MHTYESWRITYQSAEQAARAAYQEWQRAARNMPEVAVPQLLLEAAQRAHDWMERQARQQSKGGHATFDLMILREERDALAKAIAAAPQPTKVAKYCDLCKDDGGYFYGRTGYEPCCVGSEPQPPETVPKNPTLTAPVQLPEPAVPFAVFDCHGFYTEKPNAKQAQAFCDHYNKRDADGGGSAPYTAQALYTEHQVRQLLAQHGIQERST